ncbi:hypothetical protein EV702DRAFT_1251637 [Suillus placidus]|uniref:Reverse transcriptase zinc-binding domain-containing protein n=1 Tax=Suillus placidus TaxID=48579 RepID=A0A9P7CWR2_9AGAM|nr:hypothetical protein EV702DRAFT_1251637 [Suillus placidus]
MNMAMAIHAACDIFGKSPSSEQIWLSIRDWDTPKNIRGFIWKSLHGTYKIGMCGICGSLKMMEHILIDCESLTSCMIWQAASNLWCKREANWPKIHFGTILSCNLADFNDNGGKKKPGQNRLFKIIVLESAHLIWKLRCERTIKFEGIREKFHSDTEIYNRWVNAINMRLKYGKKALKVETVLKTWSGILLNEENLPDNWVHKSGVLVGMAPRHPPGQNR